MSVAVPNGYLQDKVHAQQLLSVSRETMEGLEAFAAEFLRWNEKINLVSPKTVPKLWSRHILDSAQINILIPEYATHVLDIGTGGGFPGLILALMRKQTVPECKAYLVESDTRKSAFLSHIARKQHLNVEVIARRIDDVPALEADVITTRALAPLSELLRMSQRHISKNGRLIFLKGQNVEDEIKSALETWRFTHQKHDSITDSLASVLEILAPFERRDNDE